MSSQLSSIVLNGAHVDLSKRVQLSTTIVASPAGNAETAVASLTITDALSTALGVILIGGLTAPIGTSGVSTQLRFYHGTTSGTKIGDSGAILATAGDVQAPVWFGFDNAPVLPNQVYTMSLTVGSGAAATTISQLFLLALII